MSPCPIVSKLFSSDMAVDVQTSGFWEIGNYKHNIKRIKDGIDQLDDYSKMARERADIEAKYGKALQQFSDKWRCHVDTYVPHGSVKVAWLEIISEANSLAEQHNRVKDRLIDEITANLETFRKENHHPSAFRASKEIREMDEAFEKAQHNWKKLHTKMENARKNYYNACRHEKSAEINLQNCKNDTSISADGHQKFQDRLSKCKEDVHKTRTNYEKYITEINQYKSTYIEAMNYVFDKCQATEMKRSKFFIEQISKTEHVLAELIKSNSITMLHNRVENTLRSLDTPALERDLKDWSQQNGVDAATNWPTFEEYRPEMRHISSKTAPPKSSEGVVLTRQIIKSDDIISSPGPASVAHSDNGKQQSHSSDSDTNTFDSRKDNNNHQKSTKRWSERERSDSPPLTNPTPDSAKYGDFEDYPTHNTKSNATVLYDYVPQEGDEIQLKKGETIGVLTEPDNLGWCTGRKDNGEIGLFPASYVQVL